MQDDAFGQLVGEKILQVADDLLVAQRPPGRLGRQRLELSHLTEGEQGLRLRRDGAADVRAAAERWLGPGRFQLEVLPFGDYATTESTVDRSTGLPPVGEMPDLEFPAVQRTELDNGLRVVLAQRASVPVVNVALQFDAGYAADSFGTLGTAGFTMAMLDEGTKSRDALEIAAEAESLGANISTGSNLDMSTARLSALKNKLEPSLDLFAEVVREPSFPDAEIERLRKRWLANIEQEKNQPVSLALRTLPPLMYGDDHAYGIPFTGSGTEESIN